MHRTLLIIGALLLASCADAALQTVVPSPPRSADVPLKQVPSELSLEYFAQMRLEGTGLTLGTVLAQNAAYTRYQISYQSNGLTISGILNIPRGDGPYPLLVLNHGYIDTDVYTNGRGLKREQDYLARQGFTVLHPDYRSHASSDKSPDTREIYDAGLEYSMDVVNAINAVRAARLPQVDTEYIGMLGHSMGGGIALNIAVAEPDLVNAIVLYAPVHSDAWENFLRWRDMREESDRTREVLGTREENPDAWNALSSLTELDRIRAPVLLFQGTEDADVPKEWSDFLNRELTARDKDVEYVVYDGEAHEFVPRWNDFMERTTTFFRTHLAVQHVWSVPLDRATERVTKKSFGTYITPENSPVQPERFRGYHTGTDFELLPGEDAHSMNVRAICDGEVIYRNDVNGYGGVLVQSCTRNGDPVTVLYGHLSLSSISGPIGTTFKAGNAIGTLGTGFSEETDGERPHLHLSIHRGTTVELRGYVQNEAELDGWIDPMER